ncbi:MAG: hypothetical protein A2315_11480 [Ignavibacteria bacterium RIFOXYB2_FULL_35_12]|nr:MAG: hypothetical protein A2058_00365 [Ignavibacteria bacterium GWA2_36_19]OGU55728.1 MAG: hypothetical protein A2006_01615 [Ignavibacteria bacterium GWC2_35_8]OGU56335.1 MAG: hypothetical protein A2X60_11815 [Ignavibacteria bacterium GWF2_35_20]OGU80568.1 MAG: hypothetical protein A2254_04130 [Ignavibacteria bacterium RIFOXYA2_FULL_35_9]OGU94164.1 MAG: hypothetical protein A2347_08995 [Ignavibacteria bacterium RIFOXYB12_FULL_35_14]OGV01473.1 MAG: hypothetical protein A2455_00200 [Ignavibac
MNSILSLKELNKRFETEKYLIISDEELTDLLKSSQIIFEQDTRLRDFIKILKFEDHFYLQEKTNLGEIIIRQFKNKADAMNLLNDRMEIYDKMWDGCGCKINYYE